MTGVVRKQFGAKLAADWADIEALSGVVVKVTEKELDEQREPVALIRQKTIARTPEAPLSHRNYSLLITLIASYTDADAAAEQLDVLVEAALDYLDTSFSHEEAELVAYNNRLAYDVPVMVRGEKD